MSNSDNPTAFPLAWPIARKRTASCNRRRAPFKSDRTAISVDTARRRLRDEVERMGATDVILSTNLRARLDGSIGTDQRAASYDPGAALYFRLHKKPVVLACDSYDSVAGNIAAIAMHVKATRAIERYGVGSLEQIFAGFTALPPAMSINDWRRELGNPKDIDEAEVNYRELARKHHPDVGGDAKRMAALNAAITEARKVL